jgi:hypothetical protein
MNNINVLEKQLENFVFETITHKTILSEKE